MAALSGTIVASRIVPSDSLDAYATHDADYGRGGYRSVTDITERDAIPDPRRKVGMKVWVNSESKEYQLIGDITNSSWIEVSGGSGGSSAIDATPTIGSANAVSSNGVYQELLTKEDDLGTPSSDGYVLSSTTGGIRSWVAMSGGSTSNERTIAKTAHGLAVGNWITGAYTKGTSTDLPSSEVIGVVTSVTDANHFTYLSRGFTSAITSALPAGTLLLLQNDGTVSNTEGNVHKEVATVVDGGLEIDIKMSIVYDGATVIAAVIDDTQTLVDKTWSSSKLSTMVIPTGGTTGQVLVKTSATNYAVGWTTVATSLASLTDATITTPISGQYLTYNGTKWVNSTFVWTTANDVEITNATKGVILKSANGTRYRITVDNDGSLITTEIV